VPPPGVVREDQPLSGVNLPSSAARMTRGREEWVVLD
jgi:hypothetical protein